MIASGDYTDMIMNFSDSSYTLASAYEDGVILDLSEIVEEFSPNYYAITHAQGNEDYARDITDDEGHYLCYWMLQNTSVQTEGYWIRQDMLNTIGYEGVPTTYDQLEEAMLAIRASGEYPDLKAGLLVNSDSYAYYFSYGYDIPSSRVNYGLYHIDDTVYSCYTEDNMRDYFSMLNRWYGEDILNRDFVSMDSNPMSSVVTEMITTDQCIIYSAWNNSADGYKSSAVNPDFEVVGIPDPVKNEGDVEHFANASRLNTMHNCVITSAAEDRGVVETCMRYADWWYTDTGCDLYNYGVEGKVWNWNDDHTEREYTELVTNDPNYAVTTAWGRYAVYGNFIGYSNEWRSNWSYSGVELDAMETWTNCADNAYSLPTSYLTLTADESSTIKTIVSDVETYVSENLAKFVIGDKDINDDAVWAEYTSTLESMGIDQIVAVYQAAYDRYLSRG
jgi:putative aldouronate transport system substrate-binding protein